MNPLPVWMRSSLLLLGTVLAMATMPHARAQGLSVLDATNRSDSGFTVDEPHHSVQFSSRLQVSAPVNTGLTSEVDLRLSWLLAATHEMGGAVPPDLTPQIGWGLTLRVHDPLDQGYSLNVDTRLRGVAGAQMTYPTGASTDLPALRFGVYEMFATTPTPLPGAATSAHGVDPITVQLERVEVDDGGSERVGQFRGTRDFLFFLESTALNLVARSPTADSSLAWQQFGVATNDLDLAFANPLPSDPDLQNLGQFFRVSASFNAAVVPEPGSWALLAAGLGLLALRRRPPPADAAPPGAG
jgi:PEP-CTERM motif